MRLVYVQCIIYFHIRFRLIKINVLDMRLLYVDVWSKNFLSEGIR